MKSSSQNTDQSRVPASIPETLPITKSEPISTPIDWGCSKDVIKIKEDQVRFRIGKCLKNKVKNFLELKNETNDVAATFFQKTPGFVETDYLQLSKGLNKFSFIYKDPKGNIKSDVLEIQLVE